MSDNSMPTAGEIIFTSFIGEPRELDEITFDDVDQVDNPLAVSLVATLRSLRAALSRADAYRFALKQAIELLHQLTNENRSLKRRDAELLEQFRGATR